jgi:hypothetical protein
MLAAWVTLKLTPVIFANEQAHDVDVQNAGRERHPKAGKGEVIVRQILSILMFRYT